MNNYVQPGNTITLTAPSGGVVSGTAYQIGSLLVVAQTTAAEGAKFEALVNGVVTLPKAASQAWTEGAKIYWDNAAATSGGQVCTTDATKGMLIGVAAAAVDDKATSTTGIVRLNGVAPAMSEGPQAAIAALTDSTGGSDSHDDTLADGLTATAPDEITAYAAVTGMTDPVTKAEGEAISAALATAVAELTALRAVVAALVTDVTAQNQNDSDLAQKVNEYRTALIAAGIIAAE
jgi:predicted RecA/RadA family phage recombinase